jgi:predicted GTPase
MAFGEEAYPDLDSKAAALLHAIAGVHPLVDGDKRLGWVATRLFYRMNSADPSAARRTMSTTWSSPLLRASCGTFPRSMDGWRRGETRSADRSGESSLSGL